MSSSASPSGSSSAVIDLSVLNMVAAFSPDISLADYGRKELDLRRRKRRIRRKERNPFPFIVASDIRRLLPCMIVNATNSCDARIITSFFETYCVPSCQMHRNLKDPRNTPSLEKLRNSPWPLKGLSRITEAMRFLCGCPDLVFKLEGSCIQHTPRGPGSKVIMKTVLTNTMIDETFVEFVDQNGLHRATTLQGYDFLVCSGKADPTNYIGKHVVIGNGFVERTCEAVLILHLDNRRRIYCIEIIGKVERTPKGGFPMSMP